MVKKFNTYGPMVKIPLVDFGLKFINAEVITHSKMPLKVVIAIKCEANFRLPSLLSNILKSNFIKNWIFRKINLLPKVIYQNKAKYCIFGLQKRNFWCEYSPPFSFVHWIYKSVQIMKQNSQLLIETIYLVSYKWDIFVDLKTLQYLVLYD